MKTITIPATELWDEKNLIFIQVKETKITIEHSLVSVSKWEQKWHIPFFAKKPKTSEQILDYIKCMTITQNVDPNVYSCLSNENLAEIKAYIEDPMTATWFSDKGGPRNNKVITNEVIYCYMFSYGIPIECQKWHINHLITLINVCKEEAKYQNAGSNKRPMTRNALSERNALNAKRRSMMHSKG